MIIIEASFINLIKDSLQELGQPEKRWQKRCPLFEWKNQNGSKMLNFHNRQSIFLSKSAAPNVRFLK